tara:strand:- start:1322 stop:1666 length:345 start_codon:yes stop_codon:yes gene_type:complete
VQKKRTTRTEKTSFPPRGNLDFDIDDAVKDQDTKKLKGLIPLTSRSSTTGKTKDRILLLLRTRIKSLRELREFLQNKVNELKIEERALQERVTSSAEALEEGERRRTKKSKGGS